MAAARRDSHSWLKPGGSTQHSETCRCCQPSTNALEQRSVKRARRARWRATKADDERVSGQRDDHERGDDELEATFSASTTPLGPQKRPGNCGDHSGERCAQGCWTDVQDAGEVVCIEDMVPATTTGIEPRMPCEA